MNSLVVVNICIVSLHLCILVSLTTASELGISSCRYLGEMEENGEKCHEDVVKVEKLPKQCSSFVYCGVKCTDNYIVEPNDPKYGLERLGSLVEYEGRSHPVFLFYSHGILDGWHKVLLTGDFSLVAQNVQNFIRDHPVKGLILHEIEQNYLQDNFDGFHQNLTAYVKAIKDMNPNLEIGLYVSARIIIQKTLYDIRQIPYFDFSKINSIMDFYLVEFNSFNDCSAEFLHIGITPMDSEDLDLMTLDLFAAALDKSTIAKDKIYLEFLISPKPDLTDINNYKPCEVSYNEYCENENDQRSTWCVDNTDILYKKGAFTKQYAKGFVGTYIDLVDRDDKCKCGKYSTFEMMVNGFNGETDPKNCDALKGS